MKKMFAPLAAAVLSLALAADAAPIYMKLGDAFKTRVTLSEAAKTPGGGMLAPGAYEVEIAALGGQEVRATFFDKTGRKAGEANGKIVEQGGATQAHGAGGGGGAGKATFQDIHFSSETPKSFVRQGQSLNLVIGKTDTIHILIGLLLPAVQKLR